MTSLSSEITMDASFQEAHVPAEPPIAETVGDVLGEVSGILAPVWPLKDYVAVNPYFGLASRSFLAARSFLRMFSDCETLMPLAFYAAQFRRGQFTESDVAAAMMELRSIGFEIAEDESELLERLAAIPVGEAATWQALPANGERRLRTAAEQAAPNSAIDWSEAIRDEIGKVCAAHYDDGQASWRSPWRHLSLYQAWRSMAVHDRSIETLGLDGFRGLVDELPQTSEAAILYLLQRLGCPQKLWTPFLLAQAFSIPGWCAWAKYQDAEKSVADAKDLHGLLAIRLAYDWGVSQTLGIAIDWEAIAPHGLNAIRIPTISPDGDVLFRWLLLRASEIAYRRELLDRLTVDGTSRHERKAVQMIFCIDVRSERIRRHLEAQSDGVETLGFAGFFGMPIEFLGLGNCEHRCQLPVLLKPQIKVHQGIVASNDQAEQSVDALGTSRAIDHRLAARTWRKLWKGFQTSAFGCFPFVEATGLWFGWKLLARALGVHQVEPDGRMDGVTKHSHHQLSPTFEGLSQQGFTSEHQASWAEAMLRNMGLIHNFSRLVVFCGHGSQTENNPLAAGLDCGACGGHSGEPNARFAALLLNQSEIRAALAKRGIEIPEDTHFMAALHNTTTDGIEFFDTGKLPASHKKDFEQLQQIVLTAGALTRTERLPSVGSSSEQQLMKKASDWSEVRPEWGLAGNAAFVVAPRSWTKHAKLDGRVFLHSYDYQADPEGKVLELIMTAPMVVANWINMQYYASTVDGHHFGSGNKTVHNVVGRFGILSGNGGDLQTGLPWQSLHSGRDYQHIPLRLQVVIAAPRSSIERILGKHDLVANLVLNGWLHLVAVEAGRAFRLTEKNGWQEISATAA